MDLKLRYGLILLGLGVFLALIVGLVTISKLGRVIAPTSNLVMFYITLFLAFAIFFGSIGFLTGVLVGVVVGKIRR